MFTTPKLETEAHRGGWSWGGGTEAWPALQPFFSHLPWKPVLDLVSWTEKRKQNTGVINTGALR